MTMTNVPCFPPLITVPDLKPKLFIQTRAEKTLTDQKNCFNW